MPDSLNSSIGYFSDGLVRGLVTFCIIPAAFAYLTFGLLGIVATAIAHWFCYLGAMRVGASWLGFPETTTSARPKHWLLGFGIAIVFQLGIVLLCVASADQETVSGRLDRILSPESASDREASKSAYLDEVRDAARADRLAGRYEDALEKHVWYHENALNLDLSHAGVRLTFALSDWGDLGEEYPPALEKMAEFRERAEIRVRKKEGDFRAFREFAALNRYLDDNGRTVSLFQWLDANDPEFAKVAYGRAQKSLVAAREFELCSKYIDSVKQYQRIARTYRLDQEWAEQQQVTEVYDDGAKLFAFQAAQLVAILAIVGRHEEASDIADQAVRELGADMLVKQIREAESGITPVRIY